MISFVVFFFILATACAYPAEINQYAENEFLQGIHNRIAGGEIAKSNQFPFQARLVLNMPGSRRGICGGSLISDQVIITAAHCLKSAYKGVVHLGLTNVRKPESTHIAINVEKKNFIIHNEWNRLYMRNDIALIKLPNPVKFNDAIEAINLPSPQKTNLDNQTGIIAGFGRTENIPGPSNELRFVARQILPGDKCKKVFYSKFRDDIHICVDGSDKKSACQGDSGGPLFIEEENGSKTLVGLTSYGRKSCVIGKPVVYTRITPYLEWINKNTGIPIKQ